MNKITRVADGQLYDANHDPAILTLRSHVKQACARYNQTPAGDSVLRHRMLKNLLGKCGANIVIEPPFYCDYGSHIFLGENFYANHNLIILDAAKVTIGDNVFIGPNVGLHTAGHPLDYQTRNQGLEYALPITLGNNVWIGAGVNIVPGVSVGDNSVIGAGSVVTKNIPANVVAAGNPCRVLREISQLPVS